MEKPNSEILRELVINYIQSSENNISNIGILLSISTISDDEYKDICRVLGSIKKHLRIGGKNEK